MKKLLSLFCLFILLTAFTCENEPLESDIQNNTNNNTDLVGTWDLVEFSVDLSNDMELAGQTISSTMEAYSTDVDYTMDFTSNTFTANGSYTYNTTVAFDGEVFSSEPYTLENVTGGGNYSTSGNEITVDGAFYEFDFDADVDTSALDGEQTATYELSDDGQTLTFVQNQVVVNNDQATGTTFTSNVSGTSVWTRQ